MSSDFEWKDLGGKRYARPMDGMERFWYGLAMKDTQQGARQFDLVLTVQISRDFSSYDIIQRAKDAWLKMRLVHPGIVSFTDGEVWIYKAADDDEIYQWQQQTFVINTIAQSSQDYIKGLTGTEFPTMHYLKDTSEFVLHSAHYYMDGKGAVTLMGDFLSELSELSAAISENDVFHLPRSATSAIGIPSPSKVLLKTLLSDSAMPKNLMEIPYRKKENPNGASTVFRLSLSSSETKGIATTARVNGVSVTHFVHAALIVAAKHRIDYAQKTNYSTLVSTDLRSLCQGLIHTGSGAASLRMAWWPMSVEVDDFWTTVKSVRQGYSKIRDQQKVWLSVLAPCLEELSPRFEKQFFSSFILSSMGDVTSGIQQPYHGFKIKDLWGTILVKNNVIFTHVRTLYGGMDIAAAYNESFHDLSEVKGLLDLAKEIMIHASNAQARL